MINGCWVHARPVCHRGFRIGAGGDGPGAESVVVGDPGARFGCRACGAHGDRVVERGGEAVFETFVGGHDPEQWILALSPFGGAMYPME